MVPGLQACTARSTWTTATPPSTPCPGVPSALTTAPAWTRWAATAAPARPASWVSAARATSTSACPTPATPAAPRTACSASMPSTASAAPATPVGAALVGGGRCGGGGSAPHATLVPRTPLRVGHQRLQGQALQERGQLCGGLQHGPRVHLQMPSGRCHGQQVVVGRAPGLKGAGGHPRSARLVPWGGQNPPVSPLHPQPARELEGTRWLVCLDPTLLVSLETVFLVSFCLERFSRELVQEGSCVPPPPAHPVSCINIWLTSRLP